MLMGVAAAALLLLLAVAAPMAAKAAEHQHRRGAHWAPPVQSIAPCNPDQCDCDRCNIVPIEPRPPTPCYDYPTPEVCDLCNRPDVPPMAMGMLPPTT